VRAPLARLTVVGVGLIGGSLAWGAKQRQLAGEVVGVEINRSASRKAVEQGVVDRLAPLAEGVVGADLVVLAIPVGLLESVASETATLLKGSTAVVTDVGSVKAPVVARLAPLFGRFVGGHPMAGSERSGVEAASATLFDGAPCVVTPTATTDPVALDLVERFWRGLGATVVRLAPDVHDEVVAAVSHLPHLAAASLVNTAAGAGNGQALAVAGRGFRDTTRVAAGSPELWRDICLMNQKPVLKILADYAGEIDRLRDLIARADGPGLLEAFSRARSARGRLTVGGP
jgi:prephenate dehydrogenase